MRLARNDRSFFAQWWWSVDLWTLLLLLTLTLAGGALIFTTAPSAAARLHTFPSIFIRKRLLLMAPAVFLIIGGSTLEIRQVFRYASFLCGLSLLAMLLLPFMGVQHNGAVRWLTLAGLSLQPSEFVKPGFAVLSSWLISVQLSTPRFPGYALALGLYLTIAALLLLQPDVGQLVLLSSIWFSQLVISGVAFLPLGILMGFAVLSGLLTYIFSPHVQARVEHFLHPTAHNTYQITHSLYAFAHGGFLGRGPGQGVVKYSLPDNEADFVFSVVGEEFGALACLIILVIFLSIFVRSLSRVLTQKEPAIVLAVASLLIGFTLQALINMASALALIPTKGMTLPFLSYGGSSFLATSLGMGFLLALTAQKRKASL